MPAIINIPPKSASVASVSPRRTKPNSIEINGENMGRGLIFPNPCVFISVAYKAFIPTLAIPSSRVARYTHQGIVTRWVNGCSPRSVAKIRA